MATKQKQFTPTDDRPHPDVVWSVEAQSYKCLSTGQYLDTAPPTERFSYRAAKPFRVEQHTFQPGDELGEGTVTSSMSVPAHLAEFTPADDFNVAGGLRAGHIAARLRAGLIESEAID